ncbi:MAG: hypothetical protein Q8R70_10565, partial [Methanoregula sp.]|nr:hypothetical protein [Methanoregula sp.]
LEHDCDIYLWADITQCCVLVQEIKCLFRSIGISATPAAKAARKAPSRIEPDQSDLFSFDDPPCLVPCDPVVCDDCPCDPAKAPRPVELHAACLDCDDLNLCKSHDPHAGCYRALATRLIEQETQQPKEEKIPHIGWCSARACQELDWEGGICITTGKKIKEQTYCPTQHLAEKERGHGTGGGPQPYVQHCCGTCGHHKSRKTFYDSCPRLGELLFKGGTKSAKVLMDETASTPCEHWTDIPGDLYAAENPCKEYGAGKNCDNCLGYGGGIILRFCPSFNDVMSGKVTLEDLKTSIRKDGCGDWKAIKPKRDTPEWFAALTEEKRRNNPDWLWEVWKHDPAKGAWLYEGTKIQTDAYALKERIEETRPENSKVLFSVRKRPDPDYKPDDTEGPCKVCKIECLDDNNGCQEFEEHSQKLDGDGEPPGEIPSWPVCIISCGKAKIWDNPGKKKVKPLVYASEAYTGPLFTMAKNYAEQSHRGPWYILSDKYGLILPGEEIENYDISPDDIKNDPEFFDMVHHRARTDSDLSRTKKIILISGKIHQDIIERAFPDVEIFNPVQGLTQGERMKVLKNLDPYGQGTCNNCQNSAVNVILDSCPRLEKGICADDLYNETETKPCLFWGKRQGPGGTWLNGKKPVLARGDGPYEPEKSPKKSASKKSKKEETP